jgi:hypothetical protein
MEKKERMNWGILAVEAQVGLMVLTGIGYAIANDWSHTTYWIFAIGLTVVVTWWFK